MRILLDVNVVLDVVLQRQEWLADAQAIWNAAAAETLDCCLPASSITDIFYITRKIVGVEKAREIVGTCLRVLTILPVDHATLVNAWSLPEPDFEDAVQIAVAIAGGLDAIVTRDESGFSQSPVPVLSPAALQQRILG